MTTEDYVSFETAKLLKEKGFDEYSVMVYNQNGSFMPNGAIEDTYQSFYFAPTLQMATKWLREEKGIAVIPVLSSVLDNEKFLWDIKIVVAETNETYSYGWVYEKQEDACETAIRYCLENLV